MLPVCPNDAMRRLAEAETPTRTDRKNDARSGKPDVIMETKAQSFMNCRCGCIAAPFSIGEFSFGQKTPP